MKVNYRKHAIVAAREAILISGLYAIAQWAVFDRIVWSEVVIFVPIVFVAVLCGRIAIQWIRGT